MWPERFSITIMNLQFCLSLWYTGRSSEQTGLRQNVCLYIQQPSHALFVELQLSFYSFPSSFFSFIPATAVFLQLMEAASPCDVSIFFFTVYLKFTFNWESCNLPGNLTTPLFRKSLRQEPCFLNRSQGRQQAAQDLRDSRKRFLCPAQKRHRAPLFFKLRTSGVMRIGLEFSKKPPRCTHV